MVLQVLWLAAFVGFTAAILTNNGWYNSSYVFRQSCEIFTGVFAGQSKQGRVVAVASFDLAKSSLSAITSSRCNWFGLSQFPCVTAGNLPSQALCVLVGIKRRRKIWSDLNGLDQKIQHWNRIGFEASARRIQRCLFELLASHSVTLATPMTSIEQGIWTPKVYLLGLLETDMLYSCLNPTHGGDNGEPDLNRFIYDLDQA
jgi:hypothetical protein